MNRSLRQRVVWIMWILSAMVCVVTVFISTYFIVRNVDEEAKHRIRAEQANLVALGLVDLISLNAFHEIVPRLPETLQAERLNEIIRIYTPPGKLVYANLKQPDFDRLPLDRKTIVDKDFYLIQGEKEDFLVLLRSDVTLEGGVLWVEIATPRRKTSAVLAEVAEVFSIVLVFLLITSFLLATYLSKWGLKPFVTLSEQIDRLDLNSPKTWEPLATRDQPVEFRQVIEKVDQLLQRTQSTFLRGQRMAQFVAHEVRTPLTILRGEMETALENQSAPRKEIENTFRSGLEEVNRIEKTVQMVLKFGREGPHERVWEPRIFDIHLLLSELLTRYSTWAGRSIELKPIKSVSKIVYADPELLSLLLGNLLRNIARHTPYGVSATITVEDTDANQQCRITLSDTGPGLPIDALAAANNEFGTDERLGVGLTLCKEISNVGRLGLTFENRPEGGLKVSIKVPRAFDTGSKSQDNKNVMKSSSKAQPASLDS